MICPNCGAENNEGSKYCRKCGTPLEKKIVSHEKVIESVSPEKKSNDTLKIIIVVLIVVAVVLAGAFLYIGMGSSPSEDTQGDDAEALVSNQTASQPAQEQPVQASQPAQTASKPAQPTSMTILGGSFSTGSGLSDKTYAKIYVGPEHAGENVKVQIYYSRDGADLNNGNVVPKTVTSNGYIEVASADSYKYYPDLAEIYLYDTSGNMMDYQIVSLNPTSGSQSF